MLATVFRPPEESMTTRTYEITPINTKDLLKFLRPFSRPTVPVSTKHCSLRQLMTCHEGFAEGFSPLVHGIRGLEIRRASEIWACELKANDLVVGRVENPDRRETLVLPTVADDDVFLVHAGVTTFTDLRLLFEPHPGQKLPAEVLFSYVPLLVDLNLVGQESNLDGFVYYSEVGPERYLTYAEGSIGLAVGSAPETPRPLRLEASVRPKVNLDVAYIVVSIPMRHPELLDVVSQIPPEWVLEVGGDVGWPRRRVKVSASHIREVCEFCREKGAWVKVQPETYWTDEQRQEMLELSNISTDAKYAMYCKIKGIEGAPKVPLRYLLDPPTTYVAFSD